MCVIHSVVLDQDVFAAVGHGLFFESAAFHAKAIVAGVHCRVDNQRFVAVAQVNGVAVLRVPWATHCDIVDYDVLAVDRMHVEPRRVLKRDALYQDAVAVGQTYKVVAHSLLSLRRFGYVWIAVFHLPRIPQLAIFTLHATHGGKRFPFHVAHLAALHGAPLAAVAVHDALAGYRNVLPSRRAYARLASL